MILVCIQDFGPHKVGDEVEVPDGDDFSPMYFAEKSDDEDKQPAQVTQEEERAPRRYRRPAQASDEALGENTDESSAPVVGDPAAADPAQEGNES